MRGGEKVPRERLEMGVGDDPRGGEEVRKGGLEVGQAGNELLEASCPNSVRTNCCSESADLGPRGESASARGPTGGRPGLPFHAPQARALCGEAASATSGPQGLPTSAARPLGPAASAERHGPRAGFPRNPGRREAQRISPWSFRFRCRNLRFRFSIFLRKSFIGK